MSNPQLRSESFSSPLAFTHGAGDCGGLFYRFAEDHSQSLAEILAEGADSEDDLVHKVQEITKPWWGNAIGRTVCVSEVLAVCGSQAYIPSLAPILSEERFSRVGRSRVLIKESIQHGDLHPSNLLVNRKREPLLIDFALTQKAPSALDPITLELSVLFHPDVRGILGDWPNALQISHWEDLDTYLENCPISNFIRRCRAWTIGLEIGRKEIFSTVFGYSARQLQFPDVDHDKARILAEIAVNALEE